MKRKESEQIKNHPMLRPSRQASLVGEEQNKSADQTVNLIRALFITSLTSYQTTALERVTFDLSV